MLDDERDENKFRMDACEKLLLVESKERRTKSWEASFGTIFDQKRINLTIYSELDS